MILFYLTNVVCVVMNTSSELIINYPQRAPTKIRPLEWNRHFGWILFFGSACCWELEDVVNISDMLLFMLFVYGTFIHRNAIPTVTYILPVCFLCWTTENTRLKPNFPPKRIFTFEKDWAVDIVEQTLKFAY